MAGKFSGAATRIQHIAPRCTSSHCIIHGQALEALISSTPTPRKDFPRPALSLQRKCQSPVRAPSAASCALPVTIQLLLFLSVLLKGYLLRFRDSASGFFYPETKWKRALRLYSRLLEARRQNIRLLAETGRRKLERLKRDEAVLKPEGAGVAGRELRRQEVPRLREAGTVPPGCPAKRIDVRLCSECAEDFRPACPTCAESAKPGRTGRATPEAVCRSS